MLLAPEFEGAMAQSFSCGPSERGGFIVIVAPSILLSFQGGQCVKNMSANDLKFIPKQLSN